MRADFMTNDAPRDLLRGEAIPPPGAREILDPKAPYEIAQTFVLRHYFREPCRLLHHHNGAFYAWSGRHYPEAEEGVIRSQLYSFLHAAYRRTNDGDVQIKPRRALVNDVMDALKATVTLERGKHAPAWLETAPVPAAEIVACRNGLLHLASGQLLPHTPEFFSHNVLDFDFNPAAPDPLEWLAFLKALWPNDDESIATLQEIFGLCLTGDTKYQKAFMIIGPRRSGKGTIARVLTAQIGRENVVAPSLSSLADQFGPATLIRKRLACISDARISKRADLEKMAERLLSITGEDDQTIDRKYLNAWTGRLQVRFVVLTNELPQFDERSGALAGRFIILSLTNSFFGREDLGLTEKLLAELPGVLNWSIAGLRRLKTRGYFLQPKHSAEMVGELEELISPIKAYVTNRCVLAPEQSIPCSELYNDWCQWAVLNGTPRVSPINLFSRDLRAVVPHIAVTQPRQDGKQVRFFEGIGLRCRELQPNDGRHA